MRDPIDELTSFDPGGDMNPLPPSEIRRRGDRLRRRNTLLVAAGAAAAVVLIATPLAVLGAQRADDGPDPAPSPPTPTPTEIDAPDPGAPDPMIPESFPLAAGWPADSVAETEELGLEGPSRSLDPLVHEACGETLADMDHADRLMAQWVNVEDARRRQLTTYADADQAVAAVSALVEFYRQCPSTEPDAQGHSSRYAVQRTNVGGESWAILHTNQLNGAPNTGGTAYHVIRVGSAVLVLYAANEGGMAGAAGQSQIGGMTSEAAEPIAAMCRFTVAGCGGGTTTPSASGQLTDADLVTAAQLPNAYGLTPYEELPPYDGATLACQAEWLTDMGAEELVSREFGAYGDATDEQTVPSGQVNTAVLRFADTEAATAAYDTIRGWVETCDSRVDDRWTEAGLGGSGAGGEGPSGERSEWHSASFCEDPCTADWFARIGYAQIGDRVVVVQLQELGAPGSREPKIWGMDEAITTILDIATERARP